MREMSSEQQRSQGVFVYFVGSQVQVMDKTLSSTSLVHMTRSFTNPIHPTNHSRSLTDAHNTLNYPLYIAVPVGVFGLILFLILLIFFIRKSLRKRRLRRDLLPHYGYDHSEAEVFDGYTQFSDGSGSIERLPQDNSRSKTTTPDSEGKSSMSLDAPPFSQSEDRARRSSTPKEFVNSLSV